MEVSRVRAFPAGILRQTTGEKPLGKHLELKFCTKQLGGSTVFETTAVSSETFTKKTDGSPSG
ncbi:hypothetical protein CSUI_003376 [Cystoisospora suis]|uniref:Uncharacterized protein n=1 Tax=Cystoisospora suis TaxID=483139 RepID=A0A2C6KFH8_9APIC|nr:hypothetical protein CSUI_003376 [Cystoisospora suis]